jgi:hypothetical protein
MKGLACIKAMPLCPGCKNGGGNPTCEIRICALKKNVVNCSQCDALIDCKNFESMEQSNPKIKEELRKLNHDQKKAIEKWMSELKTKWPHCVLLCETCQETKKREQRK